MDEDVGLGHEAGQRLAGGRIAKVEAGAALAQRDLGRDRRLVPVGRIDAQHLGAVTGQEAGRDRAGEHPRQVQHLHPGERAMRVRRRDARAAGLSVGPPHDRLGCDGAALRVGGPVGLRAHGRRAAAPRDDRALEIVGCPGRDGARHGVLVGLGPKHGQRRGPMARRVGVQADPAVAGAIVAGDRIPRRRRRPSLRADREGEPERREPAVDGERRGAGQLGERQRRCADRAGGKVADREGGRQSAGAGEGDARRERRLAANGAPDRAQEGLAARVLRHGSSRPAMRRARSVKSTESGRANLAR